jgi:phenylpyruvate tautomerase PptA (4-oxalocrotonate tautomerase family)
MAIVRIDLPAALAASAAAVAGTVNAVMQEVLSVPPAENYVVCQLHQPGLLLHAPGQVSAERLSQIVFVQVTLNTGRAPELKARFFAALTDRLVATGLQRDNVYINLVEVAHENWSFGQPAA